MKKDLMRKYLQTKLDVENFNTKVNNCTNIVLDFNSFLNQLHKQWEEYLRNVKGKQRYYDLWQDAEQELKERYPDFDCSMAWEMDNLQKDLKDAEYEATHATREESRAYCAGMWNVGFHHDTVPDDYVRKKARNKAVKIKIELHKYKHLIGAKQLYDNSNNWFKMYSSYNKDVKQFENSKDNLYKKLIEKYSTAQSAQEVLLGLYDEEIRLAEIVKGLPSSKHFTLLKVVKVYIPEIDKRTFEILCLELKKHDKPPPYRASRYGSCQLLCHTSF